MKRCPYCSAEIEDNARFCLYCMASLEPKKVIKGSKTAAKRWHISIAAFLVVTIFAVSLLAMSEGENTPTLNPGFSQSVTSFYLQDSSETTSYLPPSSETEQTHSNSTSTSSKNSVSASTSTSTSSKVSGSSSTSSKAPTSTSSEAPISSQPEQNITRVLTESDCTYRISGSEAILLQVNSTLNGNIIIPERLGGYPITAIGTAAFNGCNSITDITLHNGIKEIGLVAFRNCTALKSINIPEGVTELNGSTFSGCTSLTSIILPSTLTSVGKNAFEKCTLLENVYFTGSKEQKKSITFDSGNDSVVSSATWHYDYKH